MHGKDGELSDGMKREMAEDQLIKHARETADGQMLNELIKTPTPHKKSSDGKKAVIGYNRNLFMRNSADIEER